MRKAKAPSRRELRRRELVIIRQIVSRHVSIAFNAAAEAVTKTNPNGKTQRFNADFCDALLAEWNSRRDWFKGGGKKAT